MEPAVPAKPQNTFERQAAELGSTQRSASSSGQSRRGNNRCEVGLHSWEGACDSAEAVL